MQATVEALARDVFPAEVLMPDGSVIRGCRVFVTSHRAWIFTASGRDISCAAVLHLSEPGSVVPNRGTLAGAHLELRTDDGTAWVNRGRGCGCSSPLKALAAPIPWGGRR